MAEFPLDPQLSKMIVAAPEFKCSNEILRWATSSQAGCRVRQQQAASGQVLHTESCTSGPLCNLLPCQNAWHGLATALLW